MSDVDRAEGTTISELAAELLTELTTIVVTSQDSADDLRIALDYAETVGQHCRVGLYTHDERGLIDSDADELETAARDLVTGLGSCWDVNQIGPDRAELSFERDL